MTATQLSTRTRLDRVLHPRTVALVGVRDGSPYLSAVQRTIDHSQTEVVYVNPSQPTVQGAPTYPSLDAIPGPIDVVYLATNAERSTAYVEQAVGLDIGGMILVAGGFAETGPAGQALQKRVVDAASAGGFPVVGPNCLGVINVPEQVSLAICGDHKRRPGGISVVSQSGALLNGVSMAAWQRPAVGLNLLISAGNEAVLDLADYLDYLVDDEATTAIGLVIEKVRRPREFFAAVRRALAAGKPIVALKLARSDRTRELAASHTGALTGDAWTYEVALRQLGVSLAYDTDELVDRLALIEQLGEEFRTPVDNVAILTFTGGYASLTADLAADEGVQVPALDDLRPWIAENIPGSSVPNPLDATGLGVQLWPQILEKYGSASDVDACIFVHPLADEDAAGSATVAAFLDSAETYGKPFVLANCAGPVGSFADALVRERPGAAAGWGPRSTLRGLESLTRFAKARASLSRADREAAPIARPQGSAIPEAEGMMLSFADATELLTAHGIPAAPFELIGPAADITPPSFAGPYVVKLADVAHRTDHDAVSVNVSAADLPVAVERLRDVAARDGLPSVVAVQPMIASIGEAFIGVQNTELGPLVVFGLGGVLVEVLNRVAGRLAPFGLDTAREMIAEFDDLKIMHGFRGQPAWSVEVLADILVRVGDLAAGTEEWLDSLDINPLLVTGDGFCAVDALCFSRD